jgi:hypothetical protein
MMKATATATTMPTATIGHSTFGKERRSAMPASVADATWGKKKPIREAYADRRDRERCRMRETKKRRLSSSP